MRCYNEILGLAKNISMKCGECANLICCFCSEHFKRMFDVPSHEMAAIPDVQSFQMINYLCFIELLTDTIDDVYTFSFATMEWAVDRWGYLFTRQILMPIGNKNRLFRTHRTILFAQIHKFSWVIKSQHSYDILMPVCIEREDNIHRRTVCL